MTSDFDVQVALANRYDRRLVTVSWNGQQHRDLVNANSDQDRKRPDPPC